MSLDVSTTLLEQAGAGKVQPVAFIDCIRESLPHAWEIFTRLGERLRAEAIGHVIDSPPTMQEEKRAQLLRALASNAIRGAVGGHFGYVLAFQNCHVTGAFSPGAIDSPAYREFTSVEAQVLNQSPERRDC